MKNFDMWDMDKARDICCRAGMEKEWIAADGETFESVIFAAAEKLC